MALASRHPMSSESGLDWSQRFEKLAESAPEGPLRAFYRAGAVAADTPLCEVPLVALDLETTGMQAERHGIVSIGLVPFTLDRIRCSESGYWVVRPRRTVSSESIAIHHITHAEFADAPDLGEILEDLLGALAGRVVVVHYLGIERPFLARAVRERLGAELQFPIIDTLLLEARVYRRGFRAKILHPLAALLGRQPTSLRLAQSRARYGLPLYRAHHALTDALASAELLQAQVAWRHAPDIPVSRLWC